jgi:hypothetical protein
MALDPENKPKEFLVILVATGIKIFGNKPWSDTDIFTAAEKFVAEAEQRYGKLNP